jgi:hypothetical protein
MDSGVKDEVRIGNVVGIVKTRQAPTMSLVNSLQFISHNYLTCAYTSQENYSMLRIIRMRTVVLERCQYIQGELKALHTPS